MKPSMVAVTLIALITMVLTAVFPAPVNAQAAAPSEFRAFWVDAFGVGIYNEAEIDTLVADAKAANANAIIAQVGRRGDCFCNNAIMPRTQAFIAAYPFDPLQTLIEKAHAQGIEVHAWVIATTIWSSNIAPLDPNHVFNTHGPSATGYDNWLMLRNTGSNYGAGADRLLDPGHPAAADYIVRMFTSIVENYDVDGIHFDRIRYPDTGGPNMGYNPVSVARFQTATGRTDVPAPTDPQWMQWRRDQVTNIVRRVYLESTAIKPDIRVSASTITYGYGPVSIPGGWEGTRTYAEVLQDWRGWMEEGILDLNVPMNYKREHVTTEPGNNQQRMYHEWNEFIKDNQYNRQSVIGAAIYLNTIDNSIIQIRKAQAPSAAGFTAVGWSGYSYRTPSSVALANAALGPAQRAELIRAMTQPSEYDLITPPVFAEPAVVPEMTWKTQPVTGHLMGTVKTPEGVPFDQLLVSVYDAETDALITERLTDGNGWFGFVDLAPGMYKVMVDPARAHGRHQVAVVRVDAGIVATAELTPFVVK